ncbi:MAG: hypothetical protein ACLPSW_05840, partial [Roseiarcus sp.]
MNDAIPDGLAFVGLADRDGLGECRRPAMLTFNRMYKGANVIAMFHSSAPSLASPFARCLTVEEGLKSR